MTNNKLSPVTVYVPVSVKDELPSVGLQVHIIYENDFDGSVGDDNYVFSGGCKLIDGWHGHLNKTPAVTHWLKEQQGYFFTREELEELLGKAMDKMENRVDYENNKDGWETVPPSKDEIIQSLF